MLPMVAPQLTITQTIPLESPTQETELVLIQTNTLIAQNSPLILEPVARRWVVITAFSSTPDQTDSTPFITASGTRVHEGTIACNFLPFGTRVQLPELYGDKIFTVEDRMAWKNRHKIDIWFPTRNEALQFGRRYSQIIIL